MDFQYLSEGILDCTSWSLWMIFYLRELKLGIMFVERNYLKVTLKILEYIVIVATVWSVLHNLKLMLVELQGIYIYKSSHLFIEYIYLSSLQRSHLFREKKEIMDSSLSNKEKSKMAKKNMSKLICCKLYISESRNSMALDSIERAARHDPDAVIVNKFEDRAYNRVRYTLVSFILNDGLSTTYSPMRQTLLAMAEAAYAAIDLETHSGAHPRFGVVDHICFHPLAQATLDEAAMLAKLVASDMGNELQVPVFLYEAAHPEGKALDEIRRELGYYRPNFMGHQWAGWAFPEILPATPNEGPIHVNRARGMTVIGASPWIDTFNVPILSTDVPTIRRIARTVSARGGGLQSVQALGLVHGDDSTEIACMLLDPRHVGADQVQSRIELVAAQEGLEVEKGYFTDFSQDMIVERFIKLVSND